MRGYLEGAGHRVPSDQATRGSRYAKLSQAALRGPLSGHERATGDHSQPQSPTMRLFESAVSTVVTSCQLLSLPAEQESFLVDPGLVLAHEHGTRSIVIDRRSTAVH